MVERATGFEPATSSLGSWHSTLNYARVVTFYTPQRSMRPQNSTTGVSATPAVVFVVLASSLTGRGKIPKL